MTHRLVGIDDFRRLAAGKTSGEVVDGTGARAILARDSLASVAPGTDLAAITNRTISYIFSTEQVARDGHTVSVAGFDLTGFSQNRVFLWAHDSSSPPIGRVENLVRQNGVMRGDVTYADADLSPFADMIFRMVKARFINATSISWRPLEWKFSTDRTRNGGIDFIRQDLLEISQVPIPSQVTALVSARSAGIDTAPMVTWAERLLDGQGMAVVSRAVLEQLHAAAKAPVTHHVFGADLFEEQRQARIRECEIIAMLSPGPSAADHEVLWRQRMCQAFLIGAGA